MRRNDREIKSREKMFEILSKCDVIRLGINKKKTLINWFGLLGAVTSFHRENFAHCIDYARK